MQLKPELPFPSSAKAKNGKAGFAGSLRWQGGLASRIPRRLQYLLLLVSVTACFWLVQHSRRTPMSAMSEGMPPNYYGWHDKAKAMPQNSLSLPPPQGKHGRYVRFDNWYGNVGWGNAMQEMIMNAHIAYKSDRIFTMYNYTWKKETREDFWTYERGDKKDTVPSRIPLNAILDGPIAGGPFPVSDWRPPAISSEFFDEVCPHPKVFSVGEVKQEYQWSSGATIMARITELLKSTEDRCVHFLDNSGQFFDFWIFGDGPRMQDIWPQILESPILTQWRWSQLITSGVEHNRALIHPGIVTNDIHRGELPGLLAIHVRRGDFDEHCKMLSNWCSFPNAFNAHPDFPDKHNPPASKTCDGNSNEETLEYYLRHCYPSIEQLAERVQEVVKDAKEQGRELDRIFIMTNGGRDWLEDLKGALGKTGNWKNITTSREMELTWEQRYVAQAMDQLIATRAEVFIANPWSSLSSNVNLLRMAYLRDPMTSRLL